MRVSRTVTTMFITLGLLITVSAQQKIRTIEIYKWRNEPIKILSVRIDDKDIVSKEKFVNDNDDWFSGLTVEIENTSNKKIANIQIAIDFPKEIELKGSPARDHLWYGTNNLSEPNASQQPLNPGEKAILKIQDYQSLRDFLDNVGHTKDLKELRLSIESVLFIDNTKWAGGQILIPDPDDPNIWRPEKKQKASIKNDFLDLGLLKAANFELLPFLNTETPNNGGCHKILGEGNYSCPSGCTNSYYIRDPEELPRDTPGSYYWSTRETRCKNTRGVNCDTTVRSNQEYYYLECGVYGGGCRSGFTTSGDVFTEEDSPNSPIEPGQCGSDYYWDETTCRCVPISPIVVDVLGNGFSLTNAVNGVRFDINGDGNREQLSWTSTNSDDAWLALDRNENGLIDSGRELFGNFTPQQDPPPGEERNGFRALAKYDKPQQGGNDDGWISASDNIFSSLRLWQDTNHNGISEQSELHTLVSKGLTRLDLDYHESNRVDAHGNQFKYRARVRDAQGAQLGRWAWDVFLVMQRP